MTAGSDIASGRASSLTEAGPSAKPIDHRPPGRVGERLEGQIEARRMVKHVL